MQSHDFSYAKRGMVVRLVYLVTSLISFFFIKAIRHGFPPRVILCYHAVTQNQYAQFERQMRYISNISCKLEDIENSKSSSKLVAVTFDDAFECLLATAIPITKKLNIPISIFAVTGNLGRPPAWSMDGVRSDSAEMLMSEDQLKMVSKEPHCLVGSHTVTHCKLAYVDTEKLYRELADSRARLEQLLGFAPNYLALPHGSYNDKVIEAAISSGYKRVLTLDEVCEPRKWCSGTVGRFSASPEMWFIEFILTVNGAYAWLYPWRSFLRSCRGKVFRYGH